MIYAAKKVLDDCRTVLQWLEDDTDGDAFRIHWVGAVTLARAVGHVLSKVDAAHDPGLRRAIEAAYKAWKTNRTEHAIFWDFIENERNAILKEYEFGFQSGDVALVSGASVAVSTFADNFYRPLTYGPYAGEDAREVLRAAIAWWEEQFRWIESATRK